MNKREFLKHLLVGPAALNVGGRGYATATQPRITIQQLPDKIITQKKVADFRFDPVKEEGRSQPNGSGK